jgi:hypothetical protein
VRVLMSEEIEQERVPDLPELPVRPVHVVRDEVAVRAVDRVVAGQPLAAAIRRPRHYPYGRTATPVQFRNPRLQWWPTGASAIDPCAQPGAGIGDRRSHYRLFANREKESTIAYYSPKGLTQVKRNSDGGYQSCLGFTWTSSLGGYSCYTPMLNDRGVTSYATGWAWTSNETNVGSGRTASH